MCYEATQTTWTCSHVTLRKTGPARFCLFPGQTDPQLHFNVISKVTDDFHCPSCIARIKGYAYKQTKLEPRRTDLADQAKIAQLNQCAKNAIEGRLRYLNENSCLAALYGDQIQQSGNAEERIDLFRTITMLPEWLDKTSMYRTFATHYTQFFSDEEEKRIRSMAKEKGIKLLFKWSPLT
ncbi:hypothetical protein GGR57DRAFT_393907 [Xylariaceae sp. FL1272]|nr:hypothetical protein GGR57DRAFT_393907 [Xylariaceae sp. FL1272]